LEYGASSIAAATTTSASSSSSASLGASGLSVAYLQGLSKSTTAYAAVSNIKNGSGTNAFGVLNNATSGGSWAVGGSTTLIALGLNKKF
jgi:hypothetical protein